MKAVVCQVPDEFAATSVLPRWPGRRGCSRLAAAGPAAVPRRCWNSGTTRAQPAARRLGRPESGARAVSASGFGGPERRPEREPMIPS